MSDLVYLDNAATTWPKPPEVLDFMHDFYRDFGVNPGRTGFDCALQAEEVVRESRESMCRFFGGTDPERLVFAHNATDALNLVIQGRLRQGGHAVTTHLEHNSVLRPLWHLSHDDGDIEVDYVPFDDNGFVDPEDFRRAIRPDTKLVIVNHASNVIGTVQPVAEIGRICREAGVFFAIDAAQTSGVVPIDMQTMGVDAVCFTGHKSLFASTGIGGVCIAEGAEIAATRWGGTGVKSAQRTHLEEYPYRLEAGTLNTMGIAGLIAGQKFIASRGGPAEIWKHEMELVEKLWNGLREIDGVKLYCAESLADHVPALSCNVVGFEAANTANVLDVDHNVATRYGLHCAPLVHDGIGTTEIGGTVRFSFGPFNTAEHVDIAIDGVKDVVNMVREMNLSARPA